MITEQGTRSTRRARSRAGDWVWNLYPPVVFGLMAMAVAVRWIVIVDPHKIYSSAAPDHGWYHVFRKIFVPWFCTIPPLVVPLFVALRFWRFGGLDHRVAPDGTFFRNRPWWTMTRTGLVYYGELMVLLLLGLLAGMILNRPFGSEVEKVMTFATGAGLGLLTTAVGVGVTIPTWIMFLRMLRDRVESIGCLAFVFVSASVFVWMVSVGVYWWGLFSALGLFITFGALNIPLLFIVPAGFGNSRTWRETLRLGDRREWSRNQVHFLLGIVYLTLLTALVIIVSLYVWPQYLPLLGWTDGGLPWITERVKDFHRITAGNVPNIIICHLGMVFLLVYKEIRMAPGKAKSQINMVVALLAPTLMVAYLFLTYMALSAFLNHYVAAIIQEGGM